MKLALPSWTKPLPYFLWLVGLCACPSTLPEDEQPLPIETPKVIALAGADIEALEGEVVTLDGAASRALSNEALSLTWSQIEGPAVSLTNPTGRAPSFVAPLAPALLQFRLRAEVGGQETFDFVDVFVGDENARPSFYVQSPPDFVATSGDSLVVPLLAVGARRAEIEWRVRPFCGETVNFQIENDRVFFDAPQKLPCALIIDAEREGVKSATVSVVVHEQNKESLAPLTLDAPLFVEPGGAFDINVDNATLGAELNGWLAFGAANAFAKADGRETFEGIATRAKGPIILGVEERREGVSGGIHYVIVDVTAGANNRAPLADAGVDRKVRPGETFVLDASASSDADSDELTFQYAQKLGPVAPQDEVRSNVFVAPLVQSTLLFHVEADDGVAVSPADSVRVLVDPTSENIAPVVELATERFVRPGESFTLSLEEAFDPDSGFLSRFSILQLPDDPVILLSDTVEESAVTLQAGVQGEVYRFVLSAFDEGGLEGSATVEVHVDEIGPYVDPQRGQPDGNGTLETPFADLATAAQATNRFGLRELRLVEGPHPPFSGELSSLNISGGYHFDAGAEGGPRYVVSENQSAITFTDVVQAHDITLRHLDLTFDAEALVDVDGRVQFEDCKFVETNDHGLPFFEVKAPGRLEILRGDLQRGGALSDEAPTIIVDDAASLVLQESVVFGGQSNNEEKRVALRCQGGAVDVVNSEVTGGRVDDGEGWAIGIDAEACDLRVLDGAVLGGQAPQTRAVRLQGGSLTLNENSTLIGLSQLSDEGASTFALAQGLNVENDAIVFLRGVLRSADIPDDGVAQGEALRVNSNNARVLISGAHLHADGLEAYALINESSDVQVLSASELDAFGEQSIAMVSAASLVVIHDSTLRAQGESSTGLESRAEHSVLRAQNISVDVSGSEQALGLALSLVSDIELEESTIDISSDQIAIGAMVAGGALSDVRINVTGRRASGVIVSESERGGLSLDRDDIRVLGLDEGVGVLANVPLILRSSILDTQGEAAHALISESSVVIQHGTLRSTDVCIDHRSAGAVVLLQNSALAGPIGLRYPVDTPAPSLSGSAFSNDIAVSFDEDFSTLESLDALGCDACLFFDAALHLDESARLAEGENPLVDNALSAGTIALDVDGTERDALPDIGAHERNSE